MTKKILIAFGILDLLSFVLTYKFGIKMIENIELSPLMYLPEILLIISLIASGIFSILKKKVSLLIYYFQFPLKVTFMILTFGFLFKLLGLQHDSVGYKILIPITFVLEVTRLVITIMIHKKEFRI